LSRLIEKMAADVGSSDGAHVSAAGCPSSDVSSTNAVDQWRSRNVDVAPLNIPPQLKTFNFLEPRSFFIQFPELF
jgi:hypothetical protein